MHSNSIGPYAKVQVPDNYQDPEFPNIYDGIGCPRSHVRYFHRKMARYSDNALLMIHTFQDSLQGNALAWYIALDIENYEKWEELAGEFLRQYRFNIRVLLTREDLLRTEKWRNEELRAFTQRWKAVASQIKPVIQEDELMELFLKSLSGEYYDKLHVSRSHSFEQLVRLAERVEWRMKEKKAAEEHSRRSFPTRRDKEASNEVAYVPNTNAYSTPRPFRQTYDTLRANEPRKRLAPKQFTPLPRHLSQLLPRLLEGRMVTKEVPRDYPPRFLGFDETKACDYHMGERGHDVDNCVTLKIKVQNLIDRGMLDFKEPEPNIHQNPLPDHQGVNLIEDDDSDDEYEAQRQRRRRADRRFIEEAISNGETIALLGDNGGNYKFMVRLTPPTWSRDPNHVPKPDGWGGMDEITDPDVEIPRTGPMLNIGLAVDFQDKLKVASEILTKEHDEEEGESGGEFVEEPPKEVHQENPKDSTDGGCNDHAICD